MGDVSLLSSWNDTATKQSITEFVARTTRPDTPDFIDEPDRIAVFDNDGTLWPEAPVPFQAAYVFDAKTPNAQVSGSLSVTPMASASIATTPSHRRPGNLRPLCIRQEKMAGSLQT